MQTQSSHTGIVRQNLSTAGRGQAEPLCCPSGARGRDSSSVWLCRAASAEGPPWWDLLLPLHQQGKEEVGLRSQCKENKAVPAAGVALQPAWCSAAGCCRTGLPAALHSTSETSVEMC